MTKLKDISSLDVYMTVSTNNDYSTGNVAVAKSIAAHLRSEGLIVAEPCSHMSGVTVRARGMNSKERRDVYLENLSEQEREALRGHLDALGYAL